MAEPIEMLFGVWTRVGPRKHVLDGVHIDATWRIQLNRPCAAAMRPFVELLLLLVTMIMLIIITDRLKLINPPVPAIDLCSTV